ncbi:hypothetical protein [Ruficoccus sp. ZRK36]|uniref:hypothetical protein n=1 Tax=Ruficoccus sp. ZRK36 TaxID=2866311 RepID=UPI001C732BB2|nr:hypothetical protein [Ruficoccus sp. ZRK36]QYY37440.1 hypothetical protein K0V07_08120 [Ruficoccus sp. ZRK36]
MVAINQAYALSETGNPTQNRVGSFFDRTQPRAWRSQPPSRTATKEKTGTLTITVSGRPFWLSRDPIEEKGGLNLYSFVKNDGINFLDVAGLEAVGGTPTVPGLPPTTEFQPPTPPATPSGASGSAADLATQVKEFMDKLDDAKIDADLTSLLNGSMLICHQERIQMGEPEGCGCCILRILAEMQYPRTKGGRGLFNIGPYRPGLPPSGRIEKIRSYKIRYVPKNCDKISYSSVFEDEVYSATDYSAVIYYGRTL